MSGAEPANEQQTQSERAMWCMEACGRQTQQQSELNMKYQNIVRAKFIDRPNRFIAHVQLEGDVETVHVKNTGRCRELLVSGADVLLEKSSNPERKTGYDLVTVWKDGLGWVNIDSQTPNKIAYEWLLGQGYDYVRPEYTYGNSRFDFYMERDGQRYFMEVKGCTLEVDGVGYFPDAPTERGTKHLKELVKAAGEGYNCAVCFVIQMEGINEVRPNVSTDPAFAAAYEEAVKAGVEVVLLKCRVGEDNVVCWE